MNIPKHPFSLLSEDEMVQVSGGKGDQVTTLAIGEEGGCYTTLAIGEEGGMYTTLAIGEEGGVTDPLM
jgi:hypothetical protein